VLPVEVLREAVESYAPYLQAFGEMHDPVFGEPTQYGTPYHAPDNAFKIQWEMFLRHVFAGEPFPYDLLEGAKGVQLAELGLRSWKERRWLEVPALEPSRMAQEGLGHA
jgi:predicted dehydrogenase